MKISIIILGIIFIYAAFSTIYHDGQLSGNIGESLGEGNLMLFGYFAYVNIILLFLPLYKLYTDVRVRKDIDFYLGWMLVFISCILFFSLVLEPEHVGFVGTQIIEFLQPLIGTAGLWLFWLMVSALALVFVMDEEFDISNIKLEMPRVSLGWFSTLGAGFVKWWQGHFVTESVTDRPLFDIEKPKQTVSSRTKPKTRVTQKKKTPRAKKLTATEKRLAQELDTRKNNETEDTTTKNSAKIEDNIAESTTTSNVTIVKELEENSKLMSEIEKGKVEKPKNFKLPKIDFLQKAPKAKKKMNEAEIDRKIEELLSKLAQFRVDGDVVRTYSGPLVTTFEFKPAPNVKVSKILGLQDDLAMALSAETIRIQAPIPGRDVVGIEIPNESIDTIYLREILESDIFKESSSPLTVALGKDIVGNPFVTDIKKLPHLLIAGTTGSGKSVGINAMILSLLYRNDPDHLKLMLIDPKMLEFAAYEDIPHLITPVITEPAKAIAALANMVGEMERRYKLMAEARTKNIENYNEKVKKTGEEPFPYIVVIIDELADLMMSGGKEVEHSIARLAQKSRACGIHLVVATQRPSVDVVTGMIKANLPSRLSYRVGSRIDSKVILDAMGADSLLGRGDGLFTPPGSTGLVRIHAPWNTEEEIDEIVEYIKAQRVPEYDESYLVAGGASAEGSKDSSEIELDSLYEEAKQVVLNDNKTSISYLQRKLQIGYNRSANIIEQLEAKGVLSAPNAKGNREIL